MDSRQYSPLMRISTRAHQSITNSHTHARIMTELPHLQFGQLSLYDMNESLFQSVKKGNIDRDS